MIRKLFVVLAAVLVAAVAWAGAPLDGKQFTGDLLEQGKSKGDPDTFVFKDGKFRSVACDAYGFSDAPYTVASEGGKTTFTAVTKNAKGDTMTWKGTVEGEHLAGTADMLSGGKPGPHFTFKASAGHMNAQHHKKM
jgi:hypothetical protein